MFICFLTTVPTITSKAKNKKSSVRDSDHSSYDHKMDKTNSSQRPQDLIPAAGSSFGHACLQSMALMRAGVGLGCLFVPSLTMKLCGFPMPLGLPTVLTTRLVGGRDTVLAFALAWALSNESRKPLSAESRRYIRNVILAGFVVDLLDTLSFFGTAASYGGTSVRANIVFGGGVLLFSAIGAVGLAAYP